VLMGVWGQCPARDRFFNHGLERYCEEINQRSPSKLDGAFLRYLCEQAQRCRWNLNLSRQPSGPAYPKGKVIDMAFFRYGA
jgi:hypothetical protein